MNKYFFWIVAVISVPAFFGCVEDSEKSIHEIKSTTPQKIDFISIPREVPEQEVRTLSIGTVAPYFSLPGVDGYQYSLDNFDNSPVLVIIFTCNHCPTSQAYEDRIISLVKDYKDRNVQFVAISPNSVNALILEDLGYSDLGDSFEEMKVRALERKYNFPYLYDGDTQETTLKYGPTATPHAFIFNSDRKLRYHGRLDDTEKPGSTQANDLRSSIDAVLLGVDILEPVKETFGCPVKWSWQSRRAKQVNKDWEQMPISVNEIGRTEVARLFSNPSDRLVMINVWATWSGPSIIQYPAFIEMHRMYIGREFEFVSLSVDKLIHEEKVVNFLNDKKSSVRNYIYTGSDVSDLAKVVDLNWDGTLPYTIVLEPGGKIVYNKVGTINPLEVKKSIVDHPLIGRYYE